MLKSFSADVVFPVSSPPMRNGVVVADENDNIVDVLPQENFNPSNYGGEFNQHVHSGIICPGFINAHCHLELSHLKGKINRGTTLPGFITQILQSRTAGKEEIQQAISTADEEMFRQGIAGVGDICNTTDTLDRKKKSKILYHNFIELFDISTDNTEKEFQKGLQIAEVLKAAGSVSLTPHAPYTVTPQLLKRIYEYAYTHDSLLTIHNQETRSENEMFMQRSGALWDTLSLLGTLYTNWKPTGFASLASTMVHFPRCNKTLLVHNTYTTADDINWAHLYSAVTYWCFCPNANLYIENRLPDFSIFIENSCKILIGTDSYASNDALSVLEELKTIHRHDSKIKLDTMLKWATWNGAEFFDWKKTLGSLEKGKRPGINLIGDVDTDSLALTETSFVNRLL